MHALIKLTAFAVVLALSSSSIVKSPSSSGDNFELLILHNNDMHARFEQTSQLSGTCTTEDREAGKCYGGFPRVAYVVKEARRKAASGEGPPVLYLNAGDTYTGTAWFTIYKWKVAAEFINALQPDAVSLGNHEFDEEVEGVIPFIRNLATPVLAANLILDDVPELQNEKNLHTSIVIPVNGTKVGIIGYLTSETKHLAPKNKVEYEDEVIAIRREVNKLKKDGVNILIALGHSGYIKDLQIAKEVDGLDLVVGGHSNTFLWNNNKTEEIPEIPQGPYPKIVKQSSGKAVLVVQAYAYTKYMGSLHMVFNKNGDVIEYDGTPILLNHNIPKDPELLATVDKYRIDLDKIYGKVVGISKVLLNGDCRLRECNMGNLITDAVVDYTQQKYSEDVSIAFVQGGRIRISIDRPNKPFEMTRGDWITALPFSDSYAIVTMSGKVLRQALEHSASTWREIDSTGQFLQLSGLYVAYDLAKPPGSRVVNAVAKCSGCGKPGLSDVEDSYEYKVAMPIFLAAGGDGYTMFETLENEPLPYNEVECVINYIQKYGPVDIHTTNRIRLVNEDEFKLRRRADDDTASSSAFSHYNTSSRISIFFIVLFSYVYLFST